MKTIISPGRRIPFILFFSALLLAVGSLTASAYTTTTLIDEDFPSGPFLPGGWSHQHGAPSPGSYWSPHGAGGHNGSWVFDVHDNGYDRVFTPTRDLSGYNTAWDSVFVDFDMYMEYNWNDRHQFFDHGHGGSQLQVFPDNGDGSYASSDPLLDLSYTSDYYTYDNTDQWTKKVDPDWRSSSWRHYHVAIPSAYWFSTFRLVFYGNDVWNADGGQIAIDNVVLTVKQAQLLSFEPFGFDFGAIFVGQQSESQCVRITNNSSAPVTISSYYIGTPEQSEFSIPNELPETIGAHDYVDVCVVFEPTTRGPHNAHLVVENTSENFPLLTVDLAGIGLAPVIELIPVGVYNSPTEMFDQMFVTLGDTIEQTMLVRNVGDGNLRVCSSTHIDGDFPGEYVISHMPENVIPSGEIDTIRLWYLPTMEGLHRAELDVKSNAINGTQYVNLLGNGILPKIAVTPDRIVFDSTFLGEKACVDLRISNPGSDTLQLLHQVIATNDGDFTFGLLEKENTTILPGTARVIPVCFIPQRPGTRVASLVLFTNIPMTFEYPVGGNGGAGGSFSVQQPPIRRDTGTIRIDVMGTGVPAGSLYLVAGGKPGLDSTIIGTTKCVTDTIWNNGDADITVTDLRVQGLNASEFALHPTATPFVVRSKSFHALEVCATPAERGIRAATLLAKATTVDRELQATLPVAIFGQAVCASLYPDNTLPLFADQLIVKNSDSMLCVAVTNCGDVASVYNAHLTDETYYSVTPSQSGPVQPGQTVEFCVRFTPTATGELDSRLFVASDHVATMTLDLKGIGACANVANDLFIVPMTNAGGHSTFDMTLINSGNYDYTLGIPSLTQSGNAYRLVPPVPAFIPAGGSAQITIGYDPVDVNTTYPGTLTFPNGGPCIENELSLHWTQTTGTEGVAQRTEQEGFMLGQNYPNPASEQTSFVFTTPKEANVTVTLTDLTGYTVRTLIGGRVSEGAHVVTFDGTSLASGTYVYTLRSEGVTLSRMLVLTR